MQSPRTRARGRAAVSSAWRRSWLPALFFLGLGALEVRYAVERLDREGERRRVERLELVDRQQERLAQEVSGLVGEGANHVSHLARSPAVRDLLRAPTAAGERELGRILPPYLASFRGIDQLCLLDDDGRELLRCERVGGGVAVLPSAFLEDRPRGELVELARGGETPGEVRFSGLLVDESRVEVSEARRRVFHYVSEVREDGRHLGVVAVTVYAAPLLEALASFEALPGTRSVLLDERGELFAAPDGVAGAAVLGEVAARVAAGASRVETDDAVVLGRPIGKAPCSWLATRVPREALEAGLGGDLGATIARTLLVLVVIALGGAFFARATLRASRLRETETYLQRIREESAKQRALMEAAADLILVVTPGTEELRDTNARAREALGFGGAGEPRTLGDLEPAFGGEGLERLREAIGRAAATTGTAVVVPNLQVRGAGGEALVADARCVGVAPDAGGGTVAEALVEVALSDRTREVEMERRVQLSERLSSLGLLTAGVAHEVNNPLEGIANYLSLLERAGDEDKRRRYAGEVRAGLERIRDIVGQLVGFARPERSGGTADLRATVARVVSLGRLSRDLKSVDVVVEGLDEEMRVSGSGGRLEQVLLNLLLNAGRAMEGRGRVRIAGRRDDPDLWRIDVEDDGPGIAEEDLPRLFDPFFTRSEGTGLGLSIAYGIVRAHGGELVAANRPEGGARFSLTLPRDGAAGGREHPENDVGTG